MKTKIVNLEDGSFYSSIFEFRQKADYADFVSFELTIVQQWLKQAEDFISRVDELIAVSTAGKGDMNA